VEFFVFETPKVLLLLTLVVFGVGIVRSFFTPSGRAGCWLAGASPPQRARALLGVVTPFCSCSACRCSSGSSRPHTARGHVVVLISAPMVNEIALVLLFGLFGWKVAASISAPDWSSPSSPAGSSAG